MDLYYEEGDRGPYVPVIRDVEVRNVTSRRSRYALYMRAYPKSELSDIRVVDCRFDGVERGNVTQGVRRLTLERGLSLGDRYCLALARREGVPALTAERRWPEIAAAVGVRVEVIR